MKTLLYPVLALLTGCASMTDVERARGASSMARSAPIELDLQAGAGGVREPELRLLDSRVIRSMLRKDPLDESLGLTHPQKLGIWIGVSVVGAYLISQWIEDNVAFFPE